MTPTRLLEILLLLAATVEVLVGLLHFAMPPEYRDSAGLGALGGADAAYVQLVTYSTGILLIALGAITFVLARRLPNTDLLVPYLAIKTALWAARSLIEVALPVRLPMFGIEPFTAVVLPGVIAQTTLFAVAGTVAHRLRANHRQPNRAAPEQRSTRPERTSR